MINANIKNLAALEFRDHFRVSAGSVNADAYVNVCHRYEMENAEKLYYASVVNMLKRTEMIKYSKGAYSFHHVRDVLEYKSSKEKTSRSKA